MLLSSQTRLNTISRSSGFTIVELLIVIAVIAILAAVTIVAYTGVSSQASDVSLQADIKNSQSVLATDQLQNNAYPATAAAANNGSGLKTSPGNSLVYINNYKGVTNTYCITGSSNKAGVPRYFATQDTSFVEGACERAWVTKGAAGPSCGATCFYLVVNTADFPAGTYSVQCIFGTTLGSTTSRTLTANGSLQLSCYNSTPGIAVTVNIAGWGRAAPITW